MFRGYEKDVSLSSDDIEGIEALYGAKSKECIIVNFIIYKSFNIIYSVYNLSYSVEMRNSSVSFLFKTLETNAPPPKRGAPRKM